MPVPVEIAQTISNALYLIFVWGFFVASVPRYAALPVTRKPAALWVVAALFALAFGDSFHLIPRLIEVPLRLLGQPVDVRWWLGFGLAASSFTLSLFYLFLLLYAWRKFQLSWNGWLWALVAACIIRCLLLLPPQNAWGGEGFTPWRFYRNIPFALQGLGVVVLVWRAARNFSPPAQGWLCGMGWSILVSFACYTATLVGVLWSPLWGIFMLPKSVAYVVLVWLLFRFEFGAQGTS